MFGKEFQNNTNQWALQQGCTWIQKMGCPLAEEIVMIHGDKHTMCLKLSRCNLPLQSHSKYIKITEITIEFSFTIKKSIQSKREKIQF